jgi:hypothetical protein
MKSLSSIVRAFASSFFLLASPALAAVPQAAVVVAIDSSGSMEEPKSPAGTPFEQAVAAGSLFVAGCDPSIAPAVITFDSSVQVLIPELEPATPERRRRILAALGKARTGGRTDILGAVVAALKLLDTSKAPAKWVVLLSDGEQTEPVPAELMPGLPPDPRAAATVRAAGKVLAGRARTAGVRFLAVGLGQDADRSLLEALAVETGGAYVAVQDASQLVPTYADWLRAVGGYHVARDGEQVQLADGDADLKVLMALPRAGTPALEREGQAVEAAAGLETWSDGRRLHVWQLGRPASGTYHLRLGRDRSKDDHLVFLKRPPQHWDVSLKYTESNPEEPLHVAVRGAPAGEVLEARLLVTDAHGKETERRLTLRPGPGGALAGDLLIDGAGGPSTHTVRVRLRDKSGWEAQHVQTVRFEPARLVHFRLLDAAGHPLPGNVCTHRVLSPVAARTDELHFLLVGAAGGETWQVRLPTPEVEGVRCAFERRDHPDRLVVRLDVPAQTPPGLRSFPFDVEPGPGIRLAEDSRRFRVDVEIPEASVTLTGPSGGPVEVCHQLAYLDWLKLRILGRPVACRGPWTLTGKASGLADGVPWDVAVAWPPAAGPVETSNAEGIRSWSAELAGEFPDTGEYPLRIAATCLYRPLRLVDAAGNPLAMEGNQAIVGTVRVVPPPAMPPVLLALALAALCVLSRLRTRRVPGQLLVWSAADAALGGQRRPVRLGRKHSRVVLGGQVLELRCRWGTVQVRWVRSRTDEASVSLVCPAGHERDLRPGGAWERLGNDDTLRAGGDEAKYLAPVPRHCSARITAPETLFSTER